jgi:hypothetical protein
VQNSIDPANDAHIPDDNGDTLATAISEDQGAVLWIGSFQGQGRFCAVNDLQVGLGQQILN